MPTLSSSYKKGIIQHLLLLLLLPFHLTVIAYTEPESDYLRAVDPALGIGVQLGRWDSAINLIYDPDGAPEIFANPDDVLTLMEQAISDWELVSGIQFNITGIDFGAQDDNGLGPDELDGLVRVFWGSAGGAAGRGGPNADFYDIDKGYFPYIDGSVELNENPTIWDFQSDLIDVLIHELGHVMGLGHSDNQDSVMYANPYNHLLHPRADDIRAARTLYGKGSLDIADINQPLAQWLYSPLPAASASVTEFLFKANQASDNAAYISVGSDEPVASINAVTQDEVFVRFNLGGIGNFSNNTAIDIDATIVFVDPFGYQYSLRDFQISCDSGFACGGGWFSVAQSHVMKTIPGQWTVYVIDDDNQTTLLELPLLVDTNNDFNQPPVAEITVTGISSTEINVSLTVTDPDSSNIDVVWHPQGNLGDQDNDGFLDTQLTDAVISGQTISRDISFLSAELHTLYIQLNDDAPRYDGSNPDSSGAGGGFQSLISITVDLPVAIDADVTILSTFQTGSSDSGSGGSDTLTDQIIEAISSTSALALITTTDGSSSSAGFGAGASSDSGSSTATDFSDGDTITIAGSVTPQAGDVGGAGEIFVVLLTNSALSFLDENGNFQNWGGDLKTLEPAFVVSSLDSLESFEVFSGTVQSDLYRVFLGYSVSEGPLHFNAKAFRVTVD